MLIEILAREECHGETRVQHATRSTYNVLVTISNSELYSTVKPGLFSANELSQLYPNKNIGVVPFPKENTIQQG